MCVYLYHVCICIIEIDKKFDTHTCEGKLVNILHHVAQSRIKFSVMGTIEYASHGRSQSILERMLKYSIIFYANHQKTR